MKFEDAIKLLGEEARNEISNSKSVEEILGIFKTNKIDISLEDIKDSLYPKNGELSDDDLASVTGGIDLTTIFQDILKHFIKDFNNKEGQ